MKLSRSRSALVLALIATAAVLALAQPAPVPPVAKRIDHKVVWHGETVVDPYFWLREKTNPDVVKYLEAENAYTEAMTRDLKPFQEALYAEMLGRIKQTDLSVPVRQGKYYYYSRTEEGKQYPVYCRKAAAPDGSLDAKAAESVLLDQNEMAKGLPFLSVGNLSVSDDDNLLAYATDTTGFRQYVLHVKDLRTGAILPDTAERVTSGEWAANNRTLFFTTEDAVTKRSDHLWRLTLGGKPELLYREKDELYNVGVGRTKDKKYVLLGIQSTDTWEMRYLDAAAPSAEFKVVLPRKKGHKYDLEHREGLFYIRTNKGAKNFRVVTAPVSDPGPANWKDLVAASPDVLVEGLEVFKDYAVCHEKSAALNRFRVLSFKTGTWREIGYPEAVYSAFGARTPEFDTRKFRISYQSMVTPSSLFDYDLETLERTLLKQQEVLGGYDAGQYATERLWATARDGVKVPISIVYKKGFARDGNAPLWLYGYGSYGAGMSATFSSNRLSLLDRGVAYAIAHIRGGDEMGEAWHDDGMLMKKKNTFNDFIDCAEYLIAEKWTSKCRLMIEGGSAGGLLTTAVTNMRPDLFKAVHSAVPFADVINTMMDASLPLTVGEYLEWGNPNEKKAYDYMKSYSPYDNIQKKDYPAVLVTTSFNDSQVMYWEPAKYVAKLRSLKTDKNELLLKCKMEPAGHGGASGRYDKLKDTAFEMAWMLRQVGITGPVAAPSDKVDDYVRAEMAKRKIPGLSLAVVKNGEIIKACGYGSANVELNAPATAETIYQSGSVGKQFTATLVMMLVEEGKIKLDVPISTYFHDAPAAWKNVTVRRMLSHTAGISDKLYDLINMRQDYTEDELYKKVASLPLDFAPGDKWNYSNPGYLLLGILVHKVTGEFYGDQLQKRIFRPLGMSTARIINEADIIMNRAAGYRLEKGELKNQEWVAPMINTTADGSLYLTVLDMAKWDAALYTEKLLKKASLDEMWTPIRLNDGKTEKYGFGWRPDEIRGHQIIEHGGSWQGFNTHISRYVDDKLTVIALANLDGADPGDIVHAVAGLYVPDLAPEKTEPKK
jgi:oligopeptidase B